MSIVETIDKDLVASMRDRKPDKTAVLRLIKNGLKNYAIAKRTPEDKLTDEQAVMVLRQEVKKHKESIEAFVKGGRDELAAKEEHELAVLESYLPPLMSSEAIRKAIQDVVAEQELAPPYQFGRLMGAVVKKIAGQADGQTVKQEVEQFIANAK